MTGMKMMEDSKPKVVRSLMLYQDKAQTPLVPSIHPLQLDWPRPVHNPWACPMKGPRSPRSVRSPLDLRCPENAKGCT